MTKLTKLQAIQIWKENAIINAIITYDCGGDSMGDMATVFYTENGEITFDGSNDLADYLENLSFEKVEYYVNSDGHYMGESGTVEIILDEDMDEPDFDFLKSAEYEYSEDEHYVIWVELTDIEKNTLKKYVQSIMAEEDNYQFDYLGDSIISNDELEILNKIAYKIIEKTDLYWQENEFLFEECNNSVWATFENFFETNPDDEMIFEGNNLKIFGRFEGYVYKDE
jgi:hypothetical protein